MPARPPACAPDRAIDGDSASVLAWSVLAWSVLA